MALHIVDRNWDKLLVDNMFDRVLNSTYLGDVECMESNNWLVDMLDNAFDVWVVDMDRVLVVDNGMFVDEVFHLNELRILFSFQPLRIEVKFSYLPVINTSRSVLSLPGVDGDCNCTESPSSPDDPAFVETDCDCGTKCELINGPAG